jgi:hypothetical protein
MIDLLNARLLANPRFHLIPFDRCDERHQSLLATLSTDPNFYGVLVPPVTSSAPMKSMSRDAALLFMSLREPACAPHLMSSLFGNDVQKYLRELILDGVLEIEHGDSFVSGASAAPLVTEGVSGIPSSRVAQLSADAIAYIASVDEVSSNEAAIKLYMYNRLPCTPSMQRRFADEAAVLTYLAGQTSVLRSMEEHWICETAQEAWLVWHRPGPSDRLHFKLFISPDIAGLPEVFQVAVDRLRQVGCSHFKIGRTAFGLLRPDKFVAYFENLEQLLEAAESISASISGITAHGVPFTAAIDAEGLVSWGMDPPKFDQVMPLQEHQSWRQWLTGRIAVYALAAREDAAENILDFVLRRVRLDRVDPLTWSPNLAIWHNAVPRGGGSE